MNNTLYLQTPPTSRVDPPISKTQDELPLEKLTWEDFEKLCLRICQIEHSIDDCEIYGIKGQKQSGIDIFAKKSNGKYSSLQCKRYQVVKEATLKKAIAVFKKNDWLQKSDEFVFCTSFSLNTIQLQNTFESLKNDLETIGVILKKWDKIQISRILKEQPQIVYDFFGSEWVKVFNGKERLTELQKRRKLDANEVREFRAEFYNFYQAVFNKHDPGIIINQFKGHSIPIQDRFVMPDTLEENMPEDYITAFDEEIEVNLNEYRSFFDLSMPNSSVPNDMLLDLTDKKEKKTNLRDENRVPIDSILAKKGKAIILGDPGAGKSTLLRNIVLDSLSNKPRYELIAKTWSGYLPIWLPFAFITKNLSSDNNLSISELIKKWFQTNGKDNLAPLISNALEDERLILIIDGVDEFVNIESARLAIQRIEIHSKIKNTSVIYSSRPYGYKALKDSFQDINEISIMPFSITQQKIFVSFWYEKWFQILDNVSYLKLAMRKTSSFFEDLNGSFELKKLSENPLLLSILIAQHLKDSALPNNKVKALQNITEHLIDVHPQKRAISADIIEYTKYDFELIEVFQELAIHIQLNHKTGIIEKSEAKRTIENYLINLMGYKIPQARKCSEDIFNIGANDYGLIIEKANSEISFTHRLFQEFLAARYLVNSEDKHIDILSNYGGHQYWYQVFKFYFSLIPSTKVNLFSTSVNLIGISNTQKEYKNSITLLKYDVILTLSNSPLELAKKTFSEVQNLFEFETIPKLKENYWRIILDSLYNTKIRSEVQSYLFAYFPNVFKYSDYRISALRVNSKLISQIQKEFLVKTLINGNEYQKSDASYTIQKFIEDDWLQKELLEIVLNDSNPAIIPFAINCFITNNVTNDVKSTILKRHDKSEHNDTMLFLYKLKINLNLHQENELENFIQIQKNLNYNFKNELPNVFSNGWGKTEKLFETCMTSVDKKTHVFDREIDVEIAWKILFKCFNTKEVLIDKIILELKTEKYPFLNFDKFASFPLLLEYFKGNERLIAVLDEWIPNQEHSEPEIAYASLIGRTNTSKKYLMDKLVESSIPHWIIMGLWEGWNDDKEVVSFLKSYFKGAAKNKAYSANYIADIFKDDKKEGIRILEEMIFDRTISFRDRALVGLINIDSEYFKKNILSKFIKEELPLLPKDNLWNDSLNTLKVLATSYAKEDLLQKYIYADLSNNVHDSHLILTYYPDDLVKVEELFKMSLPVPDKYRLSLVERIGELGIIDSISASRLSEYSDESSDIIKSAAAIKYFNYLKHNNSEKIIEISKEKIFQTGMDFLTQRQIAFSGYLLTQKLDEYFSTKNASNEIPSLKTVLGTIDNRMGNSMIKLVIDNFDYLVSIVGVEFDKPTKTSKDKITDYWSFLATFSDKSSPTYPYLMRYISDNESEIADTRFIHFLKKVAPKSILLKNICLRVVKKEYDRTSLYAAQILSRNFKNDDKVKEELCKNYDFMTSSEIIALSIGWPETPVLKNLFDGYLAGKYHLNRNSAYYLKFLFRDIDNIMEFFLKVCANYNEVRYEHTYFIYPFLARVSKDNALQLKLKTLLLSTEITSAKISVFCIFNFLNKIDEEIISWKQTQVEIYEDHLYGYNILRNEVSNLSTILEPNYF